MAQTQLVEGSLYVVLYLRSDDAADTTFHWGLYLHEQSLASGPRGQKLHIKKVGNYWIPDHAETSGVLKSFLLVCLVRVADNVPAYRRELCLQLVKAKDAEINAVAGYTCRIWVLSALERLNAAGILNYSDSAALEAEIYAFGNTQRQSAIYARQPRPVHESTLSH